MSFFFLSRFRSHYFEFEDIFERGRTLGTGRFATVYTAKRKSDGEIFAVKVIDKTSLSEDEKNLLRSEIAILKVVHHPNVITTEQILEGKQSINIVTELVSGWKWVAALLLLLLLCCVVFHGIN